MNVTGREQVEADTVNVVSLFGRTAEMASTMMDPIQELIKEAKMEDFDLEIEIEEEKSVVMAPRKVVDQNQFPDQSMFTLQEQLSNLKSSLNRIKFYLGDVEDLLPR